MNRANGVKMGGFQKKLKNSLDFEFLFIPLCRCFLS